MKYLLVFLIACHPVVASSARAATYEESLRECNKKSTTFEESVSCENEVRKQFNRPPRKVEGDNK